VESNSGDAKDAVPELGSCGAKDGGSQIDPAASLANDRSAAPCVEGSFGSSNRRERLRSLLMTLRTESTMVRRVDSGPRDREKATRRRDATTVRGISRAAESRIARRLIKLE
jgi:hypothetical protein